MKNVYIFILCLSTEDINLIMWEMVLDLYYVINSKDPNKHSDMLYVLI